MIRSLIGTGAAALGLAGAKALPPPPEALAKVPVIGLTVVCAWALPKATLASTMAAPATVRTAH
jgi:hypothetical protein